MPVYFDTGLLVKLYAQEANTPLVLRLVSSLSGPILFTSFQEAELINALHLKHGRGELPEADLEKALANLAGDMRSPMFRRQSPDWNRVFAGTVRLSTAHAAKTLCRTMDAIHVATALQLGAKEFATTDKKQTALAIASGLKVLSL